MHVMLKMMITEKDIKSLRFHETRWGKITNWTFIIAPVFLVVMGVLDLYIASKIGSIDGLEFIQLFQSWIKGVDIDGQYSGIYLKAMEAITDAMHFLGFAIFILGIRYVYHSRIKMESRILETLKNLGAIKD